MPLPTKPEQPLTASLREAEALLRRIPVGTTAWEAAARNVNGWASGFYTRQGKGHNGHDTRHQRTTHGNGAD